MNVRASRCAARERGFTLVELLVVGAITALLLVVAVGGFGNTASRKRIEGAATEIVTHLQQARSEAVARNRAVQLTFGPDCFFVHTLPTAGPSTAACTGNTPPAPLGAGELQIARVVRAASDITITRQPVGTPVDYYRFDPQTGAMSVNPAAANGHGVVVGSTAGPWELRLRVNPVGRVELCTSSTTRLTGYAPC